MIKFEDKAEVIRAIGSAQEFAIQSQYAVAKEIDKIARVSLATLNKEELQHAADEFFSIISDFPEHPSSTAQVSAIDCIPDVEIRGGLFIYQSTQSHLQFMKAYKLFMEALHAKN